MIALGLVKIEKGEYISLTIDKMGNNPKRNGKGPINLSKDGTMTVLA